MSGKEDNRIFVGGLSWEVTERQLEAAFNRFGKIIECQVMMEREIGRSRGFGFITFSDRRGMEDAIREMHGQELGERQISVNKAQPKMGDDLVDHGYRGSLSSGGRGSYGGGGDRSGGRGSYGGGDRSVGQDDCFKCGRPGHWARDCPSAGGRGGAVGSFSSRPRFGGGSDRGDRFTGDRFGGDRGDRYIDDRYDAGRFSDRDRFEGRDSKYGSRDHYASDRYPTAGDRFGGDRYAGGGSDRYAPKVYDRDGGGAAPRGGNDRYGAGGPARNDRTYRNRPGPYDRPSMGRCPPSFERY